MGKTLQILRLSKQSIEPVMIQKRLKFATTKYPNSFFCIL
jgi:hypothetical protein